MRTTTAYFAGIGTVVVAIGVGVGGGLIVANAVNTPTTEPTRLEQRLATATPAIAPPDNGAQASTASSRIPTQAASPEKAIVAAPLTPSPATLVQTPAPAASAPSPAPVAAAPSQAQVPVTTLDANARLRDDEVSSVKTRDSESRRAKYESRRAERRRIASENRRMRKDQELQAVAQRIRAIDRPEYAEQDRADMPTVRFFAD